MHLREMSRLEDQNVLSSECAPHQRQITGLLLASHSLNNSGEFGVDGSAPVTAHLEPGVSCCQYYASDPLSKNVLHLFNCRHV